MEKSESIIELAKALSTFQGKIQPVKKDAANPFFKSHYATLDAIWDAIRKPLTDSGLSVTQTLDIRGEKSVLNTTLLHSSGEWITSSMLLNPVKDDPQGLGSAISYARRYSLCAMLGIVADEDDDGATASIKPDKPPEVTPFSWEAVRPKVNALLKRKVAGWDSTTAILKQLLDIGATEKGSIGKAFDSLNEIGKMKFTKLIEEAEKPSLVEEAIKLGAEPI